RGGGPKEGCVGNSPELGQVPAYRACWPNAPAGGPACLIPDGLLPTPRAVAATVDAYNAAIGRAARQEGATLVDLHLNDAQINQHTDWLSGDGFHPSRQGYAVIARLCERGAHRPAARL